jgi:phosphoketolase
MADGFTVKYRWEESPDASARAARWRLFNPDNTLSGNGEAVFNQTTDTWITETVKLSSLTKQKDAIGFYVLGAGANTTYTLYLSYIENYVK